MTVDEKGQIDVYELPDEDKLRLLFDVHHNYDKDTLLNKTLADMAEASDLLKGKVKSIVNGDESDAALLVTLEKWTKVLKSITDVVIEQKKKDIEDQFDLNSPKVEVLFEYFVTTVMDSLEKSGLSLGDQKMFLDLWESKVDGWEEEVRRMFGAPKTKKKGARKGASRSNTKV